MPKLWINYTCKLQKKRILCVDFFFFKKIISVDKESFAEIPLSIISTEFMSTINLLENYIQEIRNNIVADDLVKQGVLREDDLIN